MGFRELEYVRALAEYRSITKAAKAVGLTQPAMSMFLRSLEGQLGAPLFERRSEERRVGKECRL